MAKEKSKKVNTKQSKKETKKPVVAATHEANRILEGILLPQRVVAQIAEEVAMRVSNRLKRTSVPSDSQKKLENPLFLDTSAIIDGRIFDLIRLGVFTGTYVVLDGVLDELKHIADSKDEVKKERGRKGLTLLEILRKGKGISFETYDDASIKKPVDERIIEAAKKTKGKIRTFFVECHPSANYGIDECCEELIKRFSSVGYTVVKEDYQTFTAYYDC